MVRLTRARPLRVSSARFTIRGSASLRMPTDTIFAVGTRSVILSLTKLMTNSSSLAPATSCSSIETIWPTPCAGYTTNSLVLKPCRWVAFLMVITGAAPSPFVLRRTSALATGAPLRALRREAWVGLVAGARVGRKMRRQLVRHIFPRLGVSGGRLLGRDVGPDFREIRVQRQELLQPRLGVRLDRIDRAFRLADPAVDALVGMD